MKLVSVRISLLPCVLLLTTWTPATSAAMKRHVYEQEHFFKMVYVQIMKLLQQEEYAKNHLEAAKAVIGDTQTRMKEKSMDILGVDRNTDMDKAEEMLANYRHMSPQEMYTAYDIVKTQDTTEELVQLATDTKIFLVQNLIKVLKLTAEQLGISSEEMGVVTSTQTTYFQVGWPNMIEILILHLVIILLLVIIMIIRRLMPLMSSRKPQVYTSPKAVISL